MIRRHIRAAAALILIVSIFVHPAYALLKLSSKWKEWELGGELGLGVGAGSKSGRILCPAVMVTATKSIENRSMQLGLGYYFGSEEVENYSEEDVDEYAFEGIDAVVNDAGNPVRVRMSVIPMTVNFKYVIYESFYVGAGIGLYNIFYKKEPLGDYRVNPDSKPGEIVKSPATTALGFQQMVGMEIFPMSDKWSWFVGLKTFVTTAGGAAGSLLGITLGGKVKYSW